MGQKKEYSNLIKEASRKRGITQTWLAKELGMSFGITNTYVGNRKQPNPAIIFKVAELLSISPKELVKQPQSSASIEINMNEAIKGIRSFISAGLILVLSFAAYNKDIETTKAIALTKTVLLAILCRMTPQRLVV